MKTCDQCGKPLTQHLNEKPGRFKSRRFCNRVCARPTILGLGLATVHKKYSDSLSRGGELRKASLARKRLLTELAERLRAKFATKLEAQ